MPERRFPILGNPVPRMLGREALMHRMVASLTKQAPDHLQVVGARFSGKTVLLTELGRHLGDVGHPYTAILVWDLGHRTPDTDEAFMERFMRELTAALQTRHPAYADHLKSVQSNPYPDIAEVLDALKDDGGKVLAILDGFDKALSNGRLTRNLWDQMRELAAKPSLRLVTASRRTLRELIRHPEAQTSDFWNIFEPTPVRVGCFDEHDIEAVLKNLPDMELSTGARTELLNACNGFPVVTLEVLNALANSGAKGAISREAMLSACDGAYHVLRDKLDALWTDCAPTCQDLLRQVLEQEKMPRGGTANTDANTLIERGFVHQANNKLQRPSRLLMRLLDELPNEGSAMTRLFGEPIAYQKHMRGVLERRISQINGLDPTLKRYLQRNTEDLPDHPDLFLANIRGIVNQTFELVWKVELGDKRVPSDWIAIWKRNNERHATDWETTFPQGVRRLHLLNLMTGSDKSLPCAKYVTKEIYVLMNAAHAFGDFGQHQEGTVIDAATAYAALHLCIELAATLTRELPVT